MNADFPRILTLLRKERGISQKSAAQQLGISQALLSHYENGIRECGLEFVTKAAHFYDVSCDYLLGCSPERSGKTITIEDIPEPDSGEKENTLKNGSILPALNKKLIFNSLNILYDLLGKANHKTLTTEISNYLMLAVYKMFRILYTVNLKNNQEMFTKTQTIAEAQSSAAMLLSEAVAKSIANKTQERDIEKLDADNIEKLALSLEILQKEYPLFSSSILNLIQNSEKNFDKFDR